MKRKIFKPINKTLGTNDFLISIFNKKHFDNYLKSEYIKNTFVTLFIFVVTLILILTCFFSYHNENYYFHDSQYINTPKWNTPIGGDNSPKDWGNLQLMPTSIRVLRSVFDLSIVWTMFFWFYSIKIGIIYINRKAKWFYPTFLFLNIIPLVAIFFLFFNHYKNFDWFIIKHQFKIFFKTEEFLKKQYHFGTKKRWLIIFEWIIYLPLIPILFINNNSASLNNWSNNFWFFTVSFFTLQGNLLVFLFLSLTLFIPHWQIFKKNLFQIMVTTYITVVSGVWCCSFCASLLSPNLIDTSTFFTNTYSFVSTIWIHIVTPWTFITLSIYLLRTTYKQNDYNLLKITMISMVYPLMYAIYLAIMPFNAGVSIYSWATNLNHNLAIFANYGDPDSQKSLGSWLYILFYIVLEIIFALLTYMYAYWSKISIDKISWKYLIE